MSTDAKPLVSVIIPCHNAAEFLPCALDSVFSQTYPAIEVIVVDDGSTDGIRSVAEKYGSNVAFLHQEKRGVSVARNAGINASKGSIIAYLDADDAWDPDKIRLQVSFLLSHPECGIVHTGARVIGPAGERLDFELSRRHLARGKSVANLVRRNSLITSSVVHWRSLLENESFDPALAIPEDWDLWLRFAARTRVGYLSDRLTSYRWHSTNSSRRERQMYEHSIRVMEKFLTRKPKLGHRVLAHVTKARLRGRLGHVEYAEGHFDSARRCFLGAGLTLDWVGAVRLACTFLPGPVHRRLKEIHAGRARTASSHG